MARMDAGLTISELAERAGVSRDTISNAERGRHGLQAPTLNKIARALGRTPSEILAEDERLSPKALRRSPYEPSLLNGLEDERRAEWDIAVRNAHELRDRGRGRMQELLSSWRESRERKDTDDVRSGVRGEMGRLLQEAFDARSALFANLEAGLNAPAPAAAARTDGPSPNHPAWEEVIEADRFYWALREMVERAGLYIRTKSAQEGETAQAGQPEVHNVEDFKAA